MRKKYLLPQIWLYSSFHYIRENLMRKLYEIFKVLKVQKRIVSAEFIRGNTVNQIFWKKSSIKLHICKIYTVPGCPEKKWKPPATKIRGSLPVTFFFLHDPKLPPPHTDCTSCIKLHFVLKSLKLFKKLPFIQGLSYWNGWN